MENQQLKPCPFCRHEMRNKFEVFTNTQFLIKCAKCRTQFGITATNLDACVELFNTRPNESNLENTRNYEQVEIRTQIIENRDAQWHQALCLNDAVEPTPEAVKAYLLHENALHQKELAEKILREILSLSKFEGNKTKMLRDVFLKYGVKIDD